MLSDTKKIASLTKQLPAAPTLAADTPAAAPTDSTGVPFFWFIVGLVFGFVVIGLAIVIYN